mmetsp:Transcript_9061/g.30896  ORF Transcript_9061/g.30896 Transcript_9061/m.30896 type:complete len:271 (+) Transcript_9061:122-934(+)
MAEDPIVLADPMEGDGGAPEAAPQAAEAADAEQLEQRTPRKLPSGDGEEDANDNDDDDDDDDEDEEKEDVESPRLPPPQQPGEEPELRRCAFVGSVVRGNPASEKPPRCDRCGKLIRDEAIVRLEGFHDNTKFRHLKCHTITQLAEASIPRGFDTLSEIGKGLVREWLEKHRAKVVKKLVSRAKKEAAQQERKKKRAAARARKREAKRRKLQLAAQEALKIDPDEDEDDVKDKEVEKDKEVVKGKEEDGQNGKRAKASPPRKGRKGKRGA